MNIITRPDAIARIQEVYASLTRATCEIRKGHWTDAKDPLADALFELQKIASAVRDAANVESTVVEAVGVHNSKGYDAKNKPVGSAAYGTPPARKKNIKPTGKPQNEPHVYIPTATPGYCTCGRFADHPIHGINARAGAMGYRGSQSLTPGLNPIPPKTKPIITEPPPTPIVTPPPATGSTTIAADKTEVTFDFSKPFESEVQTIWDNLTEELRGKIATRFNDTNKSVTVKLRGVAITVGKHEG